MFGIVGILAALRERDVTGAGQQVDVSMLGVLTSLVAAEPFDLLEACGLPQRTGRMVPRLTPFGVYESADGYLAICAPTEQFARGVFAAIGRQDLARDARFATRDARVANMDAINGYIEAFTRSKRTAELVPLFEGHGVPAAEVARRPRPCAIRACSSAVKRCRSSTRSSAALPTLSVPVCRSVSRGRRRLRRGRPLRWARTRARLRGVARLQPGRLDFRACARKESFEVEMGPNAEPGALL